MWRPPAVLLIALSFGTGVADAFAFLALNGVFSANMTGNLILIALYGRPHYAAVLAGAGVALAAFTAGLFAGFRLTKGRPRRQAGVMALNAAGLAQALVVILWASGGDAPPSMAILLLIVLSCIAMACQTVAARRMGADRSVSTTFATGTLTGLVQDIVDGEAGERLMRLLIILGLPVGALVGAVLMRLAPLSAPVLAELVVLCCLIRLRFGR